MATSVIGIQVFEAVEEEPPSKAPPNQPTSSTSGNPTSSTISQDDDTSTQSKNMAKDLIAETTSETPVLNENSHSQIPMKYQNNIQSSEKSPK